MNVTFYKGREIPRCRLQYMKIKNSALIFSRRYVSLKIFIKTIFKKAVTYLIWYVIQYVVRSKKHKMGKFNTFVEWWSRVLKLFLLRSTSHPLWKRIQFLSNQLRGRSYHPVRTKRKSGYCICRSANSTTYYQVNVNKWPNR